LNEFDKLGLRTIIMQEPTAVFIGVSLYSVSVELNFVTLILKHLSLNYGEPHNWDDDLTLLGS